MDMPISPDSSPPDPSSGRSSWGCGGPSGGDPPWMRDSGMAGVAYTPLDDVSFRSGTYKTHLSLPNYDEVVVDDRVSRADILDNLHITVEYIARDDTNNPKYWVKSGTISGHVDMNKATTDYLARKGGHYLALLNKALPA